MGDNAGMVLFDLAADEGSKIVHRAAFLRELLRPIPSEAMHVNKKLVGVTDGEDGGVLLHFSDHSQEHFDMLVGADGIHGYVRNHILSNHPASKPHFAGWWDCRALVPIEKAAKILGDEYFREDRQYGWLGDGGFMMHDVLDNGRTVQCIAAVLTDGDWDPNEWKKPLDREMLEASFATWKDGPITQGVINVSRMIYRLYYS